MNYSAFIYAFEAENIAVTGTGTLDGQADANTWWSWRGRGPQPSTRQAPARGRLLEHGRSTASLSPSECSARGTTCGRTSSSRTAARNILIEGVTIINSPMWEINPVLCENVTIRNVSVRSHGPNNDGCDPESLPRRPHRGLHVRHRRRLHRAQIGPQRRRAAGRTAPIENVVIRDCTMKDGHGGVVDRQRDLRRRAQHLCRALPDGQPAARPRAAHQDQLSARRDGRRYLYARRDRRARSPKPW